MAAAAAEATPPDRTSDDETLLHCSVCQENFHPKSCLPRSLPCHHSFCGDCIDKLEQEGQVKCPMCRKVAKVEGRFPVDDTHITYLELRLPAQAEAPSCQGCPDEAKATSHCKDCSANLCEACCKAHRRVQVTRDHAIVSLEEMAQSPEFLKQHQEKCNVHRDRPVECFCKTCDRALCASCGVKLHKDGHNVVDLDDIMKTWTQKVTSDYKEFSETIEGLEVKAASLKTILEHMDTDHNHAIEDIEKTFVELQTALNVRKATLLADLGAKVKANRLALEEELATVESQISSSKATRDYNQRLLQYGLPFQFAAHMKDPVLQEAKQVKEALTPAKPIGFDTRGLQEMKTSLETFGDIFDGTIALTLKDVQQLPTGTYVSSDVAYLCDAAWTMEANQNRVGARKLGLYLACTVANKKSWSFLVHYDMKILNFKLGHQDFCGHGSQLFTAEGSGWGFQDFMSISNATDLRKGFMKDGKLHAECSFKLDLAQGVVIDETDEESEEEGGEESEENASDQAAVLTVEN